MDDTRYVSDIDMRITHFDVGETIAQRRRRAGIFKTNPGPPERRSMICNMSSSYQVTRMRNLSGGSSGSAASGSSSGSSSNLDNQYCSPENPLYFSLDTTPFANTSPVPQQNEDSLSNRKLDRSLSDSDSERSNGSQRSVNSSRYKTELCRPFEESGSCKYGDKCQFAHGAHELRNLARHPKYKTEPCRTFHTIGFCPYGPRCHFIHEDDKTDNSGSTKTSSSGSSSPSLSPTVNEHNFSYTDSSHTQVDKSLSVNINYGNDLNSLEQQFNSALNLNHADSSRNAFNNNNNTSEEFDIFSSISVFNADEVTVTDTSPKSTSSYSSSQSSQLDNYSYQGFGKIPQFWSNLPSQSLAPVDPFHHSPTGSTGSSSTGSDSGLSDCSSGSSTSSGSTESLTGFSMDWNHPYNLNVHQTRPFQYVY